MSVNISNNAIESSNIEDASFIPASENLPEITVKAVILAIILVIVLAAANGYLGLKVGTTVSASIPAAVISMGVLRLFRKSNILENNIVQTAASSGEALVGGIAYILPALVILHFWQSFNYWETVLIALVGGTLGVLFSVPLRSVLLSQKSLRFPEGTAIGQVLKASSSGGAGLKYLVRGGLVGGTISFLQAGFQVVASSFDFWFKTTGNIIYGFGTGLDPAILAAGYIIGVNVALSMLVGVTLGWIIGIPLLTHFYGIGQGGDPSSIAIGVWHSYVRYIGVGTMLLGGLWTLCMLIKPIVNGLRSSFISVKSMREGETQVVPRTERDLPMNYVLWGLLITLIPLSLLLYHFISTSTLGLGNVFTFSVMGFAVIFVVFVGFIFAAIGGYFAGLLGSTNSPGSSLTIASLLLVSLFIVFLLGLQSHDLVTAYQKIAAASLAIIITSVVSSSTVITNETIQDLKAGHIVGATPWKQQVMLILGTVVAALVIPLILQLLFNAYGIGGVFPHPGMDPTQMLAAPQAGLMATLAQGVFAHQLPWDMLLIGAIIAVFCISIDSWLKTKGTRLPVLAVGVAIYLPLQASVPIIIGGLASYFIEKSLERRYPTNNDSDTNIKREGRQVGLVLACGLVAGAALMGVILAIPFAIAKSTDVLKLVPEGFTPIANILGVVVTVGLLIWIYRTVCTKHSQKILPE